MKEGSSVLGGEEATSEEHVQRRKQPEMWSPASPQVTVSGQGMNVLAEVLVQKSAWAAPIEVEEGTRGPATVAFLSLKQWRLRSCL